jgi:hypothetical protein
MLRSTDPLVSVKPVESASPVYEVLKRTGDDRVKLASVRS